MSAPPLYGAVHVTVIERWPGVSEGAAGASGVPADGVALAEGDHGPSPAALSARTRTS